MEKTTCLKHILFPQSSPIPMSEASPIFPNSPQSSPMFPNLSPAPTTTPHPPALRSHARPSLRDPSPLSPLHGAHPSKQGRAGCCPASRRSHSFLHLPLLLLPRSTPPPRLFPLAKRGEQRREAGAERKRGERRVEKVWSAEGSGNGRNVEGRWRWGVSAKLALETSSGCNGTANFGVACNVHCKLACERCGSPALPTCPFAPHLLLPSCFPSTTMQHFLSSQTVSSQTMGDYQTIPWGADNYRLPHVCIYKQYVYHERPSHVCNYLHFHTGGCPLNLHRWGHSLLHTMEGPLTEKPLHVHMYTNVCMCVLFLFDTYKNICK